METPRWSEQLSRIIPQDADDLDATLAEFDPRRASPGRDVFPETEAVLRPNAAMKRADAVCIGLRMPAAMADAADRAMRLAAFAAERDVEVVVLADADGAGLERFGFRSERVAGDTDAAREACIDQIRRFWNIDLLL
jgi:hypothetical protein